MSFAKTYFTFKTEEEARHGLQILLQHAAKNNNFLSANDLDKIVYERDTNYDPCIGWTLGMLNEARIFTEPGFWYLELPPCYKFESLTVAYSS